jgi:hypothetical protein
MQCQHYTGDSKGADFGLTSEFAKDAWDTAQCGKSMKPEDHGALQAPQDNTAC